MNVLLDKLILLGGSFLLSFYYKPEPGIFHVMIFLWAVTFICFHTYCNPDMLPFGSQKKQARIAELVFLGIFVTGACFSPFWGIFLPLFFYEIFLTYPWYFYLISVFALMISLGNCRSSILLLCISLALVSCYLKYRTKETLRLKQDFKLLRDTSTEYNLLLRQKNKDLMQQQDYELHVATLRERNRIAREIHDNVGHMLSRSILQSGALLALNKSPQLTEPLLSLKDTLTLAMDAIRESVHDLHDDSIDLKASMEALLDDFKHYDTTFDYDMGKLIPRNIKYCFISIIKESLSNIVKHSNGNCIHITAREHPKLYQLMIEDNGSAINMGDPGIGLENMRERVESLEGHFSISTENGFRIFISIPHKKDEKESDSL